MTPQEFEYWQECAEMDYEGGRITADEFRARMYLLGFEEHSVEDWLRGSVRTLKK